ncbi:MAG: transaldolase [Planctomycetes bacterium]|nr:transaldolase [Planctomycetota bacterium]MCB9920257.1 transaldolase [Planctomycetota bacterium]
MTIRELSRFAPGSALAETLRGLCLQGFRGASAAPKAKSQPAWHPIKERGTTLWLDTGDIGAAERLWCEEFDALTTNNTLLNKEVQKGIYDEFVPVAAKEIRGVEAGISDHDLVLELAFCLNARHGLELVQTFGAHVSVELHTDLAHDIEASVAYGRRYAAICPDKFIVKVPLTASGIIAARRLADDGIPVNFTLGFSARQNLLVALLAKPEWCNVFMGRINAFLADNGYGSGENAGERATQASQHVCTEMRKAGRSPTKQIGASMRSFAQVPALAGLDVYTMPVAVAEGWLQNASDVGAGLDQDFAVEWAPGVDAEGDGLDVFWDVSDYDQRAIEAAASLDVANLDATSLRAILAEHGAPSFFPELDANDEERVKSDGKIPVKDAWLTGVREGRLAWDTMLTLAGLASFSVDQAALDARIRAQLS